MPLPPRSKALHERPALVQIIAMRDRQNDRVGGLKRVARGERNAVFVLRLVGQRQGIVHLDADAETLELAHDVDDLGIADIGHVFLEGHAEDRDHGNWCNCAA